MILDYHMPDKDGLEVARLIQNDPRIRGPKLVMLTSVDESLDSDTVQQ